MIQEAITTLQDIIRIYSEINSFKISDKFIVLQTDRGSKSFEDAQSMIDWCDENLIPA